MDREYQTADEQARWEAHIKMEREALAKNLNATSMRMGNSMTGCKASSASNQVNAPVAASIARLAELVNALDKQSEALIDRLTPVSRPTGGDKGEGSEPAQEPQCSLDDALIVMCLRVQSVIDRVSGARHRLCI
jgi:hypothetical protein